MILAQAWSVTLTLECDGCGQRLTVSGDGIPAAYDMAECAGWKVRSRIGRHYCTGCTPQVDSGRGTVFTQGRDGKVVAR